jgi:hypothetical protein
MPRKKSEKKGQARRGHQGTRSLIPMNRKISGTESRIEIDSKESKMDHEELAFTLAKDPSP